MVPIQGPEMAFAGGSQAREVRLDARRLGLGEDSLESETAWREDHDVGIRCRDGVPVDPV